MDPAAREQFIVLMSWIGLRTQGLGALLIEHPLPSAALHACDERLAELPGSTQKALHEARRHWPRARTGAASIDAAHANFIPLGDSRYPAQLKATPDPPPWLFYAGDPDCLHKPCVAIVGSRRASHGGLRVAEDLAERLAGAGYTICSGLALGIDAAAHRGALRSGSTAAVLASGLDLASPRRHLELARQISKQGCVLTELPPGTPPSKMQFPRRNRIISGLASATIIVEAALPSGSLHTAAAALEQGRDVFVLPWSVFHAQGAGCLRLLRDGATPITSLDEIEQFFPDSDLQLSLAGLASSQPSQNTGREHPVLQDSVPQDSAPQNRPFQATLPGGQQGSILRLLGDGSLSVETLARESGIPLGRLLVLLGQLEVDGWLRRVDGAYSRDS